MFWEYEWGRASRIGLGLGLCLNAAAAQGAGVAGEAEVREFAMLNEMSKTACKNEVIGDARARFAHETLVRANGVSEKVQRRIAEIRRTAPELTPDVKSELESLGKTAIRIDFLMGRVRGCEGTALGTGYLASPYEDRMGAPPQVVAGPALH
jgi:hypothetical protein